MKRKCQIWGNYLKYTMATAYKDDDNKGANIYCYVSDCMLTHMPNINSLIHKRTKYQW